jgi:C-terminal processing protease CtpA/Prc
MRITGTTDWEKYEITLDMNPANTKRIAFGGILSGNGKMWLDDLEVTIDGKDVRQLKPYRPEPFPAENDREFDGGSHIVFPELNKRNIHDLELLGRIWGFLKYHHPAIAKGNYNWDYELFRFLPDYLKMNDNVQRDELLLHWIDKLGNVPAYENRQSRSDSVFLKPDLSWMESSNMNRELKNRLQHIYQNRHQGHHYHIMTGYFGNPLFLHENSYAEMPYPDTGFRLLALYKYWNMVHYFFPSKYLTDKDWNDVLGEYIPCFVDAKDELEYELTVIRLVGEICDSHAANLLEGGNKIYASRGFWTAPVKVRFIENKLTVTGYYTLTDTVPTHEELKKTTGLKAGDIITHINGKAIDAIIDSLRIYYPASNEATRMNNMASDLLMSPQKTLRVDYITSGRRKQIEMFIGYYLNLYDRDSTGRYKFLGKDKDIGYVRHATLKDEDIPVIKREFMNTKGIILDIRVHPTSAGRLLSSWFVSSETPFIKHTKGNPDNPGEFIFTRHENVTPSKETYKGKLVVLVNEETLSEGEYQAMMFRAGRNTTIIGSQTAGADGRVSDVFLPGGIRTWISGLGVYYPDGRETQRIGIVPDIEVKPTIKGVREGRDELLEKAIEIIEKE